MKERPIVFNANMVKATLDGRKTQTRRLVNGENGCVYHDYHGQWIIKDGKWWYESVHGCADRGLKCPYGKPGDHLWVRETWSIENNKYHKVCYRADKKKWPNGRPRETIEYGIWRQANHMPRSASRIDLSVKDIRVERLQDITYSGVIREGVGRILDEQQTDSQYVADTMQSFARLWDSLNGKRYFGCTWEGNPWVWVIEFEII